MSIYLCLDFFTHQYDAKLELLISIERDVIGYLYTLSYFIKLCKDSKMDLELFCISKLKATCTQVEAWEMSREATKCGRAREAPKANDFPWSLNNEP